MFGERTQTEDTELGAASMDSSISVFKLNESITPTGLKEMISKAFPDSKHYGHLMTELLNINEYFKQNHSLTYIPILTGSFVDGTFLCLTRKPKFDFDCMIYLNSKAVSSSCIKSISEDKAVYVELSLKSSEEYKEVYKEYIIETPDASYISPKKAKEIISDGLKTIVTNIGPSRNTDVVDRDKSAACITIGKALKFLAEEKMKTETDEQEARTTDNLKWFAPDTLMMAFFRIQILEFVSNLFDFEIVPALVCEEWPHSDFFIRKRQRNWPRPEMLVTLRNSIKIYLVPKCHRGGNAEREWRYSFSEAENFLSVEMNEFARRCLAVMKALLNNVENNKILPDSPERIIKTYHLKTIVLWSLEQDKEIWDAQAEDLGKAVHHLLMKLVESIHNKFLPHYFMPNFNLLSELLDDEIKKLVDLDSKTVRFSWTWCQSKVFPSMPEYIRSIITKGNKTWETDFIPVVEEALEASVPFFAEAIKAEKMFNAHLMCKHMLEKVWNDVLLEHDYVGKIQEGLFTSLRFLIEPIFDIINMLKADYAPRQKNTEYLKLELKAIEPADYAPRQKNTEYLKQELKAIELELD